MIHKMFVATKAFIVRDGKVLIVRESPKYEDGANVGKYDIVGGRLEPGQRFDESLLRRDKGRDRVTRFYWQAFLCE